MGPQVSTFELLSGGAQKLSETAGNFKRPGDDLRLGDALPAVNKLLSSQGARRPMPSLAQMSSDNACVGNTAAHIRAPPPPRSSVPVGIAVGQPKPPSKFVQEH